VTDHAALVEEWRAERYARLRQPVGWLTLAGLDWLHAGRNRVGSDPTNDIVLPDGPPIAGTLTVSGTDAVADGHFTHGGEPVRHLGLVDDAEGRPTLLELGSLRLCLIQRRGRLAVRTWNTEAPQRRTFVGIDHWPVDARWRIRARLDPTPEARIEVPDVLGTTDAEPSPGNIVFEVDGLTHRLEALEGGPDGELWLVFGDATNGVETYGGGRYLYTPSPEADGTVVVDFNMAYNPPCVFTPYATCTLPWPANRLPIRIEAGERVYGEH
jgi:uncharacterized protein (DUF1684 family)